MNKTVLVSLLLVSSLFGCMPDIPTPPDAGPPRSLRSYVGELCTPRQGLDGTMGPCDARNCTNTVLVCPTSEGALSVYACVSPPPGYICRPVGADAGATAGTDAGAMTLLDATMPPQDAVVSDASQSVIDVSSGSDTWSSPVADSGSAPRPDVSGGVPGTRCFGGEGICQREGRWQVNSFGNRYCDAVPGDPTIEFCDGLDNDCDGTEDNNAACICTFNVTRPCYTGPAGTRGVGECRDGQEVCRGQAWGYCERQTLPIPEIRGNRRDDDCDGRIE